MWPLRYLRPSDKNIAFCNQPCVFDALVLQLELSQANRAMLDSHVIDCQWSGLPTSPPKAFGTNSTCSSSSRLGFVRPLRWCGQISQGTKSANVGGILKKKCPKRERLTFHHLNEIISVIFSMISALRSLPWCSHMSLWCGCSTVKRTDVARSNGDVVNQRPRPRLGKLPARTFGRLRVEGAFFQQLVPVENEIDSDMW